MTSLPTMRERGYREYTCPECGAVMWIHSGDGDDTDIACFECHYQTTAGDVRNRE